MDFSLFFPDGSGRTPARLSDESINDLSIDFIADALTDVRYEHDQLRNLMTYITGDTDTIRYRCDVFDDFLRLPKLREDMEQLVIRLKDLMDLERFQKDKEGSDLWSLINRLREIGTYVICINTIKETLETLDIRSAGMKELLRIVTQISEESGFEHLLADIEETLHKAARLKSVTIGVNLDDLLRPKNAAIVSLNEVPFTNSGLVRRFMDFTKNKGELNDDVENISSHFHPLSPASSGGPKFGPMYDNPVTGEVMLDSEVVTGADPLSNAIRKPVTDIMRRTVNDIKSTLKRYVNISGYSLTSLMPEIIFYIRWAELVDKITATGMPMKKA